jgi:hypothetical protein
MSPTCTDLEAESAYRKGKKDVKKRNDVFSDATKFLTTLCNSIVNMNGKNLE